MANRQDKRRTGERRTRLIIWALFGPVMLIGLGALALASVLVARHIASLQWQPVQAVLLKRGVEWETRPGGALRSSVRDTQRLSGRFAYEWQGRRHESTQVSFSLMKSSTQGMELDGWDDKLDTYLGPEGGQLQVWVDPGDPANAVALRDIRWLEVGLLTGFGFIFTWAGWLFVSGVSGRDPRRDKPAFSWRTVITTGTFGLLPGVLAPLLWRDGHPVWAAAACLPLLLALHGTCHGIFHAILNRKKPPP